MNTAVPLSQMSGSRGRHKSRKPISCDFPKRLNTYAKQKVLHGARGATNTVLRLVMGLSSARSAKSRDAESKNGREHLETV